jgi:hypothetical protein
MGSVDFFKSHRTSCQSQGPPLRLIAADPIGEHADRLTYVPT